MRAVRKLRHWKQRFDENAKFIWRRSVLWEGEQVQVGDEVPASLASNRAKLRRFWQSQIIELAVFEEPDVATGQAPEKKSDDVVKAKTPEELIRKETDRKWLVEGLDETFPSKTKALEAATAMLEAAAKSEATEKPEGQTDATDDKPEDDKPEDDKPEDDKPEDDSWLEGDEKKPEA